MQHNIVPKQNRNPTGSKGRSDQKSFKPILAHLCESSTPNERQRSKMNNTEMRFPRRIKNKTGLDRIRTEVYRDELKVKSIQRDN